MHPKADGTVHEQASGRRKVRVERVGLRHTPFRVVKEQQPSHADRYVTLPPSYHDTEEAAIAEAKAWVANAR